MSYATRTNHETPIPIDHRILMRSLAGVYYLISTEGNYKKKNQLQRIKRDLKKLIRS